MFASDISRTESKSTCTLFDIHNNNEPMINCMGMIHDFLRPRFLKKIESTIGDHSSFKEYGYCARANIASCEYERCSRRRNGTEPAFRVKDARLHEERLFANLAQVLATVRKMLAHLPRHVSPNQRTGTPCIRSVGAALLPLVTPRRRDNVHKTMSSAMARLSFADIEGLVFDDINVAYPFPSSEAACFLSSSLKRPSSTSSSTSPLPANRALLGVRGPTCTPSRVVWRLVLICFSFESRSLSDLPLSRSWYAAEETPLSFLRRCRGCEGACASSRSDIQ